MCRYLLGTVNRNMRILHQYFNNLTMYSVLENIFNDRLTLLVPGCMGKLC